MTSEKCVLITGSSRGLGRSMAMAFGKRGYTIGVHYLNHQTEAQKTCDEIAKAGGQALLLKADVRSSADVNAMVRSFQNQCGRLDILINNAGVVRNRSLFKMSDEEWRDVMSANLDGTFYCTRAALSLMRPQKEGVILNIASYLGFRPAYGGGNYAVSKAALVALTKATAVEEGKNNIRVNAVLPGFHVTDMNKDAWEKYQEEILKPHLLGRLTDQEEMAEFVVKAAELRSVTGQVFAFESRIL